jgi:hypothetical protein
MKAIVFLRILSLLLGLVYLMVGGIGAYLFSFVMVPVGVAGLLTWYIAFVLAGRCWNAQNPEPASVKNLGRFALYINGTACLLAVAGLITGLVHTQ